MGYVMVIGHLNKDIINYLGYFLSSTQAVSPLCGPYSINKYFQTAQFLYLQVLPPVLSYVAISVSQLPMVHFSVKFHVSAFLVVCCLDFLIVWPMFDCQCIFFCYFPQCFIRHCFWPESLRLSSYFCFV